MQPTGIAPDFVRFPTGTGQCAMFNGANTNLQRPVSSAALASRGNLGLIVKGLYGMTGGPGVNDDHVARDKRAEIPQRCLVRSHSTRRHVQAHLFHEICAYLVILAPCRL